MPRPSLQPRPAGGAAYRGAAPRPALQPQRRLPPRADPRAAAFKPKRPKTVKDPLAAAFAPQKKRAKASLRERPVADVGGDPSGPRHRAPGESSVFCREQPRITREAYAYVARQRAPPPPPPQRRVPLGRPMRLPAPARVPSAPKAPDASMPWLRPVDDSERKTLKAAKGTHAKQASDEKASRSLLSLEKLEAREAASDDAGAKAALKTSVRCFRCVECARLFERRPEACDMRGHTVEPATAVRRLFACGKCGKTRHSLERRPRGACSCGADAWHNRENDQDVRAVASLDAFRPALAEWTSQKDVSALVNL